LSYLRTSNFPESIKANSGSADRCAVLAEVTKEDLVSEIFSELPFSLND
jgi:hypothetical protein